MSYRQISDQRVYPAIIDIFKSGTRREELLTGTTHKINTSPRSSWISPGRSNRAVVVISQKISHKNHRCFEKSRVSRFALIPKSKRACRGIFQFRGEGKKYIRCGT